MEITAETSLLMGRKPQSSLAKRLMRKPKVMKTWLEKVDDLEPALAEKGWRCVWLKSGLENVCQFREKVHGAIFYAAPLVVLILTILITVSRNSLTREEVSEKNINILWGAIVLAALHRAVLVARYRHKYKLVGIIFEHNVSFPEFLAVYINTSIRKALVMPGSDEDLLERTLLRYIQDGVTADVVIKWVGEAQAHFNDISFYLAMGKYSDFLVMTLFLGTFFGGI